MRHKQISLVLWLKDWFIHLQYVYIISSLIGISIKLVDILLLDTKLIKVAYTWDNIFITIPLICITVDIIVYVTIYLTRKFKYKNDL